jgi:hypothetical protein
MVKFNVVSFKFHNELGDIHELMGHTWVSFE